jgi:hypothetical protein
MISNGPLSQEIPNEHQLLPCSTIDYNSISSSSPPARPHLINKTCEGCGTRNTPMWRRGPTGRNTMCNACGIKWTRKQTKVTGLPKRKKAFTVPRNPFGGVRKRRSTEWMNGEFIPSR